MASKTKNGGGNTAPNLAVQLKGISKSFGLVKANRDINLDIEVGTIHGIVGENGAGKSTLMNILYGIHASDTGEMRIDGDVVKIRGSADAISHGIGMVHQHFMLVPNFTVLENVMLGTEGGNLLGTGRDATLARLAELDENYGMTVDPYAMVGDLPVGIRQRIEIIKALKGGAKILILDEPTGVLTPPEAESLFEILKVLRADGVSILLITHKLEEIMAITDNVSIMRQGTMVAHRKTAQTNPQELAELMVGRTVLLDVDRGVSKPADVLLSVENLGAVNEDGGIRLADVSFDLRGGEILGVAGVSGNGQSILMELLSGMTAPDSGKITVLGEEITPASSKDPSEMRAIGVGHIPEDRHHHGLVLSFEARESAVLGFQHAEETGTGWLFDKKAITDHCAALMTQYDVRPPIPTHRCKNFSGGNQQKLVIAREMHASPQVLIVGQPTRGVDIGAIEFIHKQLIALRDAGCAILLVSVELDEIIGLSDRVMVMNAGRQVGIVDQADANERTLGLMMAGISETGDAA